ncbi:hypothetical protein FHS29_004509 [Saccharothrix tamanrassetensis]|uniref:Uncharacterized protein n=1 Tax=Saccharothrix tamanrassetensis TaxID=1051531 RepID=A0A841CK65_9PSEU|nr:hypothetical protein [Saccharothrix tamanrassetensis]MBB5957901.1 hypothetical protein [Saccharothrix tamanrassetensis]
MDDRSGHDTVWDEATSAQFLADLADEEAPRLFAVAVEYGERYDAHIAAYGMAFHDHAEVISTEGDFRASLHKPENALLYFTEGGDANARLLWLPRTLTTVATTNTTASTP